MKKCTKCGNKLETYYGYWCRKCDKPEKITVEELNLIKILRYCEQFRPGIEERLWLYFEDDIKNNTSFNAYFTDLGDENSEIDKDLTFIKKEFGLGDCVSFEVSW